MDEHVIVTGPDGGWLYAVLSEREKKGALRAPFLHFDLWSQVAVGLQGCIAGGCIAGSCVAGGCIVVVISPCIRIACGYIETRRSHHDKA